MLIKTDGKKRTTIEDREYKRFEFSQDFYAQILYQALSCLRNKEQLIKLCCNNIIN